MDRDLAHEADMRELMREQLQADCGDVLDDVDQQAEDEYQQKLDAEDAQFQAWCDLQEGSALMDDDDAF